MLWKVDGVTKFFWNGDGPNGTYNDDGGRSGKMLIFIMICFFFVLFANSDCFTKCGQKLWSETISWLSFFWQKQGRYVNDSVIWNYLDFFADITYSIFVSNSLELQVSHYETTLVFAGQICFNISFEIILYCASDMSHIIKFTHTRNVSQRHFSNFATAVTLKVLKMYHKLSYSQIVP